MIKQIVCKVFFILFFLESFAQVTPSVDSIPMRDGKKLAVDIYVPDTSLGQTYPVIFIQTPYNRMYYRITLPLHLGTNFNTGNYAVVTLDWRCFYGSATACVALPKRGEDGYDAIEWIASQPWCNGKIGTWGPSALGKIQFMTAMEHPPHLVCSVPLVAGPQTSYSDYYNGGVYRTEYVQQLDALGFGLSSYVLANQVHNTIWQNTENLTYYPDSIAVPTLMIGGWYDHNTNLIMQMFNGIRQSSPINIRDKHKLVMGPWAHGGFGIAQVGTGQQGELFYPGAAGWSDSLAMMFFDYHLRNISNSWELNPYIKYFQMGEDNWKNSAVWPPTGVNPTNLYFHKNGMLDNVIPTNSIDTAIIVYDPRDPSPTIGGSTLRQDLLQGPYDQAPIVETRNDILKYTSVVLSSNVVMKGKGVVYLNVSSDMKDTDFSVRLTDVYPDGRSMILMDGIKRLRFRNGYAASDTALAEHDSIYSIAIELPDVCNTFLAGHRIRVDITSSNYPRFDCNLNNGGAMYVAGDSLVANNTIYLNSINSSYIQLPLIDFTGGLNELFSEDIISLIYPNPVTNEEFSLLFNSEKSTTCVIEITDISGKEIQLPIKYSLLKGKNKIFLMAKNFSNGLYFVKIFDKSGLILSKKIVVSQ